MLRIFVSYASANESQVQQLLGHLKIEGVGKYEVFGRTKFKAGKSWREEESQLIKNSHVMISLLTGQYIESEECPKEVNFAEEANIEIIPVLVGFITTPQIEGLFKRPAHVLQFDSLQEAPYIEGWLSKTEAWKKMFPMITEQLDNLARYSGLAEKVVSQGEQVRVAPSPYKKIRTSFPTQQISQGWLTPFIGPMCYSERDHYERTLKTLNNQYGQLCHLLKRKEEKDYLTSILKSKLPALGLDLSPKEVDPGDSILLSFQAQLVKVGVSFCRLFGESMKEAITGCIDDNKYELIVPFYNNEGLTKTVVEMRNLLYSACETANKLASNDDCYLARRDAKLDRPCFGGRGIRRQLLMFTNRIVTNRRFVVDKLDQDTETLTWRSNNIDILPYVTQSLQDELKLSMQDLEWLGSLLWHLFSYNLPMFPDNYSLAFHLSLCVEGSTTVRARYSAAASAMAGDRDNCVSYIFRNAMARIKRAQPDPYVGGFYEAVAKCLCQRAVEQVAESGSEKIPSYKSDDYAVYYAPIAVTANLDKELERILESWKFPHNVLFPVNIVAPRQPAKADRGQSTKTDPDQPTQAGWALVTWSWNKEGVRPEVKCCLVPGGLNGRISRETLHKLLKGPLIIKTSGSPLHELPPHGELNEFDGNGSFRMSEASVSHRIVLTDYEFVRSMIGNTRIPEWARSYLIRPERLIAFLGYTMNEADGVFGFQGDVGLSINRELKRVNEQILVDFPEDTIKHSESYNPVVDVSLLLLTLDGFAKKIHEKFGQPISTQSFTTGGK